jgi:carbon storage regulator CsrA
MLVLGRKIGEGIIINGNIHVVIVEANRGRVRMGITEPPTVRVVRLELLERDLAASVTEETAEVLRAESVVV